MSPSEDTRLQALAQAVASGVSPGRSDGNATDVYVERAKEFHTFLAGEVTTNAEAMTYAADSTPLPPAPDLIVDGQAQCGGISVVVTVRIEAGDQYADQHELGEIVGARASTLLRMVEEQRDRARMPF